MVSAMIDKVPTEGDREWFRKVVDMAPGALSNMEKSCVIELLEWIGSADNSDTSPDINRIIAWVQRLEP